jgi:hypothetical protein
MRGIHNWKSIIALSGIIGVLMIGVIVLSPHNQQSTPPVVSAVTPAEQTPSMTMTSSPTSSIPPSIISTSATDTISATNTFVAYPDTGTNYQPIPPQQVADCKSAKPVIDLEGNPSAASESATHVYDPFCFVLPGADPKTFVALDYYYGKDTNGVWSLDATGATDDGELASERLIGADPDPYPRKIAAWWPL